MTLKKDTLRTSIYEGFYKIFTDQASKAVSGDEQEDPQKVIKNIANQMADVVSDAVDNYIKSGDINVGPNNIQVTSSSPGTPAVVSPLQPAKMV